jgi:hypothetical protein
MDFSEKRKYIKTHKKIDAQRFDYKVKEITSIIDLLNAEKDKWLDDLLQDVIHENIYSLGKKPIPEKDVLEELNRRKKRQISTYLQDPHLPL